MRIRLTYGQLFNGESLDDSYDKTVSNLAEAERAVNDLLSDPHVKYANYTILGEGEQ